MYTTFRKCLLLDHFMRVYEGHRIRCVIMFRISLRVFAIHWIVKLFPHSLNIALISDKIHISVLCRPLLSSRFSLRIMP